MSNLGPLLASCLLRLKVELLQFLLDCTQTGLSTLHLLYKRKDKIKLVANISALNTKVTRIFVARSEYDFTRLIYTFLKFHNNGTPHFYISVKTVEASLKRIERLYAKPVLLKWGMEISFQENESEIKDN